MKTDQLLFIKNLKILQNLDPKKGHDHDMISIPLLKKQVLFLRIRKMIKNY